MSARAILTVLGNIPTRNITVYGDFCLDKYLYIDRDRDELSMETGLVAYQVVSKKLYPGAGGTVTNNLRALGANIRCVGLVGMDGEGFELTRALEAIGADTSGMVRSQTIQTGTYTKPIRRTDSGEWAEMNRLDLRNFTPITPTDESALIESLRAAVLVSDAVLSLEQFYERNCSAVTDRVRAEFARLADEYPHVHLYADSRGHTALYRSVIVKCNVLELFQAFGREGEHESATEAQIGELGAALSAKTGRPIVVTVGERGAYVMRGEEVTHVPAFRVSGPIDAVGAGDATNAGLVLGLTLGLDLSVAALLGACVSSITIQQIGQTGTATPDQVAERLRTLLSGR